MLFDKVYGRTGYSHYPELTKLGILSAIEMACWDIIGKDYAFMRKDNAQNESAAGHRCVLPQPCGPLPGPTRGRLSRHHHHHAVAGLALSGGGRG